MGQTSPKFASEVEDKDNDGQNSMETAGIGEAEDGRGSAEGNAATGLSAIGVSWFGANSTYLGETDSRALPSGTTPWTQLSVVATAPEFTRYQPTAYLRPFDLPRPR